MNLNYKGLLNILGLQTLLNRVSTVEDSLTSLVATVDAIPAPTPSTGITTGSAAAETLVTTTPTGNSNNLDFGIGVFPDWPVGDDVNAAGNYGLIISQDYWTGVGLLNNTSNLFVKDGEIKLDTGSAAGNSKLTLANSLFKLEFTPFAGLSQSVILQSTTASNAGGIQITAAQSGSAIIRFLSGTVAPESAVSAGLGSMYTRINGAASELYFKKTSPTPTTGWVLVTTA